MASFLKRLFGPRTDEVKAADATPLATSAEPEIAAHEVTPDVVEIPQIVASVRFASEETVAELLRRKVAATTDLNVDQLKDWTCSKCGAALPRVTGNCDTVTCTYCGSAFRLPRPQAYSGGVHINGGTISIGGDIVGGNKYGELRDAAGIDAALKPVQSDVQTRIPTDVKIEALRQLYTIGEWAKNCEPDLVDVGKALKWLTANTPQLTGPLRIALTNSAFPRSIRGLALILLPEDVVTN